MGIPPSKGTIMSEDTNVNDETTNVTEQDPVTDPDVINDDTTADVSEETDNADELREKLRKQQEQNQRLFERAKKAEGFEKQPDGSWVKVQRKAKEEPKAESKFDEFDLEDVAVLVSRVPDKEDRETVKKYAKTEKMSLEKALNDDVVKAILNDRAEKRATANATNTGKARTGQGSASGDALYAKALKTGEIPEKAEDLDKMLESRYQPKSK